MEMIGIAINIINCKKDGYLEFFKNTNILDL